MLRLRTWGAIALILLGAACCDDSDADDGPAPTLVVATYNAGLARSFVDYAVERTEPVAEALGVLQESGAHQVLRMRLSLSLMRCAYYYDARLADAAMPALDELAEASGLAAARAMPAEVPAAERLERGIAEATARWEARDLEARGLHPATALLELSQTAFAALGVLILQFDIPAIARLRELLTPLEAVDRDNAMSVSHELVDLVYDAMRGRERVATERRLALIERLYDPSLLQGVPEFARKHLIATQLHAQGMAEVSTRQQLALSRADAIEALELQMYQGAALQIRFMVELYRGRAEQAAIYRDRIDLASMQEGSGRQTEMWLVRYLALPYAAWGDVLALRQTVQQLEELTVLHAGYSPFLSIARGALQLERGQHAEAVASLERALDLASAGEHGAWLQAMVIYVPALVRAGEHARAIEVARAIWSGPPAGVDLDRLRRVLAPSLALARAALGEVAEARDELDGLVEQARAEGETDLSLARLYEYRAQVAALDADEALFDASVREMGVHARSCGNPSLISRHELLSTRIEDADGERDLAAEETAAATRVRGRSDRDEISAERTERSGRGRAGAE